MRRVGAILLALLMFTPALAVDGVIEINQAKVVAGAFPVVLSQPGSYRLTGNLIVPPGQDGISIQTDNILLDLNGFTVFGGGGAVADGISIGAAKNVEVRNGTVRGFSRSGIFTSLGATYARVIGVRAFANAISGIELQGEGSRIDGCTASGSVIGLRVLDGGLVTNSVARGNSSFGLALAATAGYGNNVLTGNNGSDATPQVTGGGLQIGTNVCGADTICP